MDTVHECDRRTDGRTDRITITKTVQRIASHDKNVKKRYPKFEVSDFVDFLLHGISTTALKQCMFVIYVVA